ncbi:MAG: HlyC/CorC family transporter [Calditrichaeota bacterium]|nr:MAG: HlyC/CorC family transporter [Calditrichota bacterium]
MVDLAIIFISLLLSFFFSGTETAFVSVNKVRVEVWRRRKERFARALWPFIRHPEEFLYTTLIGNNIFNVAFASVATLYFRDALNPEITWLLIVTATVLMGEIVPKTVFNSLADWVVPRVATLLRGFYYLFYPILLFVRSISEGLLWLLGHEREELQRFFSQKDIEVLLKESGYGVERIDPVEGRFYRAILELREQRVRDAMVPRAEIVAVPEDISYRDLIATFEKSGHTKLPVYRRSLDDIVGMIYLKDLFLGKQEVKELVREVMFVPETKRCSDLLSEFREKNTTIAIVIDEYGGTAGLITAEDLVEELFGEIEDEHDEQEVWIRPLEEANTYWVNARIEVERLNEELGLDIPTGEDYETLAGFLLSRMGHIPRRKEKLEFEGITFEILSATRKRINSVKVILPGE